MLVAAAEGSAARLIRLLASHFLSYRDGRDHLGRHVWFLKRAQIFVADVWAAFEGKVRDKENNGICKLIEGKGFGRFDDIDCVTMFADYRVPQQLCALGVLRYSLELQQALHKEEKVRKLICFLLFGCLPMKLRQFCVNREIAHCIQLFFCAVL